MALQTPVSITNHGRESLILISAAEYRRLKELDRRALHPWELSDEEIAAIAAGEPPSEAAAFDHEYKPKRRRRG
jgi:PHD/YefM family antitoxin component YafN of YafNO toxin-antitoxin module